MRISDLIARFGLTPHPSFDSDAEVGGVRALDEAGPRDLSFLTNPKYRNQALETKAAAVLAKDPIPGCPAVQLLCPAPYLTLAEILRVMYPEPTPSAGVHPSAVLHPSVKLGAGCYVGPYCVLDEGVQLGERCVLESHVSIGAGGTLGDDVRLFPQVVVYAGVKLGDRVRIHAGSVIGSDGFGYAQDQKGLHHKVPQIGGVVVEDDVEIGSNTSIDSGSLKPTVIGRGSKIDNLVQIAHGVQIGAHCLVISQVGLAGSAKIGDHTTLAGQVGVVGHIEIGPKILVMGKSVVTKNLEKPGWYAGNPAVPHRGYQRQQAYGRRLEELFARVKDLETQLLRLQENEDD